MKRMAVFLAVTGLVLCARLGVQAADNFKVVVNSSVGASAISGDDLREIFLLNKNSLDGAHVEPVISRGGAAHEAFLKELGKNDAALQAYYRSLVFTGKGAMPKALGSDADVIAYVAKTKGAIGYVGADTSAAGVKTLAVK
jgi:hypothetical protein